jgi:hypothetical protein
MSHAFRSAFAIVTIGLVLAACSAGGATSAPSEQPPGEVPSASGDPGIGVPEPGGVELVEPQPGQQNVHPVSLERLDATASGTAVSVDAYWTSGVDPCYVLDQVQVNINDDDLTVDVTVNEGTSDPNAICVMMAVAKHTIFTFEVPAAGTWTIRDSQGGAPPVEVVVS